MSSVSSRVSTQRITGHRVPSPRAAQQKRRPWAGLGFETFGNVFGFIYTFLAGNALLAAANAPVVLALSLTADPAAAWPFFLALSLTVAPSFAGVFATFKSLNDDGEAVKPVMAFLRGYTRNFTKTAPIGLVAVAALMFFGVDLALIQQNANTMPGAALLVPLIVVVAALTVAVALTAIAGVVLLPEARIKSILKASLYLVVQRWYLSVAMLILLGIIVSAAVIQPVLGIALAPAPLLFVIWSNASYTFHAVLNAD